MEATYFCDDHNSKIGAAVWVGILLGPRLDDGGVWETTRDSWHGYLQSELRCLTSLSSIIFPSSLRLVRPRYWSVQLGVIKTEYFQIAGPLQEIASEG